jgi:uncharacterized RDD family membrane protein YckC
LQDIRAGFWIRFGANLLDWLLYLVVSLFLGLFLSETVSNYILDTLNFFYLLLVPAFWYGYTVGKRLLKIRIVKKNGKNIGIWTMVKRYILGGLVYASPLIITGLISFTMIGFDVVEFFSTSAPSAEFAQSMLGASAIMLIGSLLSFGMLITSAFMVGLREDRRSIHDFVAGTYVTHRKPTERLEEI